MLAKHHAAGEEFWSGASKDMEELDLGSTVMIQTQRGITKGRGETSGTLVDDGCSGAQLQPGEDGQILEAQQAEAFIPETFDGAQGCPHQAEQRVLPAGDKNDSLEWGTNWSILKIH